MGSNRWNQRGAVAVEFVLVLPVLLAIVLGVIDWGWYFSVREVAINAARNGARVGSLLGNHAAPQGEAAATTSLSTVPACTATGTTVGTDERVSVSCTQVVLTSFFPASLIPRSLTVSAQNRHE